jgi:hypothetical protein
MIMIMIKNNLNQIQKYFGLNLLGPKLMFLDSKLHLFREKMATDFHRILKILKMGIER